MDAKNVFLSGVLDKPVFRAQPPGFVDPRFPDHICRLKKALYNLCQAPLVWFQLFSIFLLRLGFCQNRYNSSLFNFRGGTSIIFLLVYVDDIIMIGNNPVFLWKFIGQTHQEFAIKDLSCLNYLLGLEVSYTPIGVFIGQAGESLVSDGSSFRDPTLYIPGHLSGHFSILLSLTMISLML